VKSASDNCVATVDGGFVGDARSICSAQPVSRASPTVLQLIVMTLGVSHVVLIMVAVGLSAMIQGAIGFGFSFVAVPVFLLVLPEALPPVGILMGLPMAGFSAYQERAHIDWHSFTLLTIGRLPGTILALFLLAWVPQSSLGTLFGFMLLIAVVFSAVGPTLSASSGVLFAGGMVSGLMGTAAALGGPALGIVMQRRPAAVLRSTLGVTFIVGVFISMTGLVATNQVAAWHLVLSLQLIPAILIGLWASTYLKVIIDRRALRPAVLAFAGLGAVAAIFRGLTG